MQFCVATYVYFVLKIRSQVLHSIGWVFPRPNKIDCLHIMTETERLSYWVYLYNNWIFVILILFWSQLLPKIAIIFTEWIKRQHSGEVITLFDLIYTTLLESTLKNVKTIFPLFAKGSNTNIHFIEFFSNKTTTSNCHFKFKIFASNWRAHIL